MRTQNSSNNYNIKRAKISTILKKEEENNRTNIKILLPEYRLEINPLDINEKIH